jgi:oligoribonuclease
VESSDNLVWIDMEMSGLDPGIDRILEIAVVVTDSRLETIAEAPVITVRQEESLLAAMDEWNTLHHNSTGLVERVRTIGISEEDAQERVLEFLRGHVAPRQSPLCGNSVGQDRRFLARYMPRIDEYLHYRVLDVSTIKELARRWRPDIYAGLHKRGDHRALDDIRESIAELRYYRDHFFRMQ